ncbi:MAG TPA: response regulator, partial [Desulfuromonadales bacterium]|nr:response regulator [Desulfuromonadales bacterium]
MESNRILVVDDNAAIRDGVRRALCGCGFYVETFGSGALAIERMAENPFDLVITDLKMPGMDGIEVLRQIKSQQPDVPIVMITGYSTVDTAVESMKSGAVDYISKPFTPEEIVA